mmetsp:Transcript_37854/g.61933  ORF Transcript_37854/g.61933 Transcript_37854/m.61933 type:complete len:124 (-) Transcript_37854:321-692(-)
MVVVFFHHRYLVPVAEDLEKKSLARRSSRDLYQRLRRKLKALDATPSDPMSSNLELGPIAFALCFLDRTKAEREQNPTKNKLVRGFILQNGMSKEFVGLRSQYKHGAVWEHNSGYIVRFSSSF